MSANKIHHMFEEYNSKYVNELKRDNLRFANLYEKFLVLDKKIISGEKVEYSISDVELENFKKERLLLRDTIFNMLLEYKNSLKE